MLHRFPMKLHDQKIEIKPYKELRKTLYFHVSWNISEICGGDKFFAQYSAVQMGFYLALLKPRAAF